MPDILDENGLQVKSQQELKDYYTGVYQTSYGADVNLESNTPDGNAMMGQVQVATDTREVAKQVYSSMDPDQAVGKTLDQRVSYNGIKRLNGTQTLVNLTVTTNRALTLPGADQTDVPVFTYADNSGNQWELVTSQGPAGAGSYIYQFRCTSPGAIIPALNSIKIPVTVILGVISVNNPDPVTYVGLDEEQDSKLRTRRAQSVSISSRGFYAAMKAAVENVNGVVSANVFENDDDLPDSSNVPPHSIWVVVEGNPSDDDVAAAIYSKRDGGLRTFGTKMKVITQVDGTFFPIRWDAVTTEDLYIKFTATPINPLQPVNTAAILAQLPNIFTPGVYQTVDVNMLATFVQEIDKNCLVTNAGFSLTLLGTYTTTLTPSSPSRKFLVASDKITIL